MIITKEIKRALTELRNRQVNFDGASVPQSIVFLEELLSKQQDPHDIDEILSEISGEYSRADIYDAQLKTIRRRMENMPQDVLVKISLAWHLSYKEPLTKELIDEVKRAIIATVELARQKNEWLRYALGQQAQIAMRLKDATLFADALGKLIDDVHSGRTFEVDSRLFDEFVENMPRGFCAAELLERYNTAVLVSKSEAM